MDRSPGYEFEGVAAFTEIPPHVEVDQGPVFGIVAIAAEGDLYEPGVL